MNSRILGFALEEAVKPYANGLRAHTHKLAGIDVARRSFKAASKMFEDVFKAEKGEPVIIQAGTHEMNGAF